MKQTLIQMFEITYMGTDTYIYYTTTHDSQAKARLKPVTKRLQLMTKSPTT